jgi:hypothetical protein
MKKSNKPPSAPPSALATVGALGRELKRLSLQLEQTAAEIAKTDEPSRRIALEKLNQQRSANFSRLVKSALAAEEKLGLLIEKSQVDAVWSRMMLEFRKTIEQIPRRVAMHKTFADIDPVDVEEVMTTEIRDALTALSKGGFIKK